LDGQEVKVGSFNTKNNTETFWYNTSLNSNFKHQLDEIGSEITADFDYANYRNTSDQVFGTDHYDAIGNLQRTNTLIGDVFGKLSLYSGKIDFTKMIKKAKLEMGWKSSWVENDNDVAFFDRVDTQNIFNKNLSNHFIYNENINALYTNYNLPKEKLNWQFGLRLEHTNASGIQLVTNESFKRNYLQIFPSAALTYDVNDKHTWGLSLSRRIDRPSYRQLNPFKFFLDPTTYQEGNPFLLPQLSYSMDISHTFNKEITLTINLSTTQDLIGDALLQFDKERVTIQKTLNIARSNNYGIELSIPKKITKNWNTNTTINTFYIDFKGIIANTHLQNGKLTFAISSTNSIILPKNMTAEVGLNYAHTQAYTVSYLLPFFNLSTGIQKPIFNRKGSVKLTFNDLFYRNYPRGGTKFANTNETFVSRRDTRTAVLALNYRFGKSTVAAARRKMSGADDEKRRVGAGS
jgi:hypothetical protein